MKKNIKLSNINRYELKKDKINSIVAGEAAWCDYSCGCSCACDTGNNYMMSNTATSNAESTESARFVQSAQMFVIGFLIGKL
ncbi:MAG: hypothetical protein RBR87_13695 [Bacteroidales bacterium]|jgi:hypothetical protein|nr:hypothetical protein [Bacteroidales bacterium]